MPEDRSSIAASTSVHTDSRNAGASRETLETRYMPVGERDSANFNIGSRPGRTIPGDIRAGTSRAPPKFDPSPPCHPDFEFEDASVDIQAEGMHFWVHQCMLHDFQGLTARLNRAPRGKQGWKVLPLTEQAEDVRNMLLVLYSRPYNPHDFNIATFESAFKLSSKYRHPRLRAYTIQYLDRHPLKPIERFRLSRDFDVPRWMSRAITELSWQNKPLTPAEAVILGAEKMAEVAEKRETLRFGLARWSCDACKGTVSLRGEATSNQEPVEPSTSRVPPEPTPKQGPLELTTDINGLYISDEGEPEAEMDLGSRAFGDFGHGTLRDPNSRYDDANVELQAGSRSFWVHRFMLYQFQDLKAKLDKAPSDEKGRWRLLVLKDGAEDIRNMLLVLYSSPFEPHHFDTATLAAALTLATKYGNPQLRAYAIQQLGRRLLEPIERYRLSRNNNVTEWMSLAIDDLCHRAKPITESEAIILGPATFARVATEREKIQYEKGQRGTIYEEPSHASTSARVVESSYVPNSASAIGESTPTLGLPYPLQPATGSG